MAVPLASLLSRSYLGSEFYTAPQIKAAFGQLKLNPKYINIAFAEFLDFEAYSELTGRNRASYDEERALYQAHLPDGISPAWEPAPVNEYIRQMTGLS